jgi:hypothetical protein
MRPTAVGLEVAVAEAPTIPTRASDRDALSFAGVMGPRPILRPVVGVEQEFSLLDGDTAVDFRTFVHQIGLGQPNLDPGDPNAYRLDTGSVVTRDGDEAEIASAPMATVPGLGAVARAWAVSETAVLADRLPAQVRLSGFSTHVSIEVPEHLATRIASMYVTRFSPGMLAAMDGPDAPGLRIRPRHRRLELCGDYVEGQRLADAVEYAAGSVAACVAAIINDTENNLPQPVLASPRPAIERPGWFIDRGSLGVETDALDDLVASSAVLARRALDHLLAELEELDGRADQIEPLSGNPFGRVLGERERPGFALAPVMVTWPSVVFIAAESVSGPPAFVAVPRDWLGVFLDKLDEGELDDAILGHLIAPRRFETRADSWADVAVPGLFDSVPSRLALLPAEPGVNETAQYRSR